MAGRVSPADGNFLPRSSVVEAHSRKSGHDKRHEFKNRRPLERVPRRIYPYYASVRYLEAGLYLSYRSSLGGNSFIELENTVVFRTKERINFCGPDLSVAGVVFLLQRRDIRFLLALAFSCAHLRQPKGRNNLMEPATSYNQRKTFDRAWLQGLKFSSETLFVAICTLFALVLRLGLLPSESVISWDGTYYASLGRKIVSDDLANGISAYWSPFYSFLVGISSLFFSELDFAGKFVSISAGAALVIPTYLLIRDFYGRPVAQLGALLIIIQPALIRSSMWVMTESVYTLVFTCILLIGWRALRSGKGQLFFYSGLLLGIAYLTKPEAVAFLVLFLILLIGSKLFRPDFKARSLFMNYLLLLLGFSIFFLPYVALIYQKTGELTISKKLGINAPAFGLGSGGVLKLINNEEITLRDQLYGDQYSGSGTIEPKQGNNERPPAGRLSQIRSALINFTFDSVMILKRQILHHIPNIFPVIYPFALLIIVGLFYKPWTKLRTAKEVYLISFFFFTVLIYALTVDQMRYLIPLAPLIICWIAFGVVQLSDWANESASRFLKAPWKLNRRLTSVVILLLISVPLVASIPNYVVMERSENLAFDEKQAGLWIKHNSLETQPLVMSSGPVVAFYADSKHLYVPNESFPRVLEYASRKGVDYLVFANRRIKDTPDAFPSDPQNLPPGLNLVYENKAVKNFEIIIYQLTY